MEQMVYTRFDMRKKNTNRSYSLNELYTNTLNEMYGQQICCYRGTYNALGVSFLSMCDVLVCMHRFNIFAYTVIPYYLVAETEYEKRSIWREINRIVCMFHFGVNWRRLWSICENLTVNVCVSCR